jgi:2-polyprenyl-3-methyl-5-hydroxy-6-metoxy-1,4-benzoquinol methylase
MEFAMTDRIAHFGHAIAARADRLGRRAGEAAPELPMMDAYLTMMKASALITAGRIGLFEALADGPLTTHALAEKLDASEVGIERITGVLVETGHLERAGRALANSAATARWFTSHGDVDYSAGLVWTADAWTIMGELPEAIRRGGPARPLWDRMDDELGLGIRFSRYMRAFAHHLAPDLLRLVRLPPNATRLLDLGGSHGIHALSFCRQYPELDAVIVDFESALRGTRTRIQKTGLAERITVRPGDLRACDWGEEYDVVLYLSIAHNMSLQDNERVFAHLATVMRPGGKLVIHDYPGETTPSLFGAAFGLTLLVETGTRTFDYAELSGMLEAVGFAAVQHHVLAPAEKGTIIIAERKGHHPATDDGASED